MPPRPLRTVKLPSRYRARTGTGSSTAAATAATRAPGINGSAAYQDKLKLLTYNMALAQPDATTPLLAGTQELSVVPLAQRLSSLSLSAPMASDGQSVQQVARRWVRDSDELCVASIRRSNSINRINTYVATYKFQDPQWKPFLLPEVHVLPCVDAETETAESPATSSAPPPPTRSPPQPSSPTSAAPFEVFIDYNKMNTLELISRHANYALRHLVQKGHAMYLINYAQHSILEMRGLVESSYITCAYGIRGERLRTHMLHIGPLDVRDVIEVDPDTHRVSFNFDKKGVRKGVVAISQVEGYGTWFQRKPMLWQRTRRIGALQSQLGAFNYDLCAPEDVGRLRDYEVSLLAPHMRIFGSSGAEAVGLVASSQVAQNDRLYMGEFEAPVLAALDAVQQLAHASARHHKLVQSPPPVPSQAGNDNNAVEEERSVLSASPALASLDLSELAQLRQKLASERLLPVSWVTRTPPPYVPLEGDLPFKLQMSKPSVFRTQDTKAVVFPTGGTVGSPFVRGVPLSLLEYNLHQGVDHYVFDDAPSARPMKWWNQKSNMPYNGHLYCMRSGLLDYVVPAERLSNPLAPQGRSGTPHRRSSAATQRRKRLRKQKRREATTTTGATAAAQSEADEAASVDARDAERAARGVALGAEHWDPRDGLERDLVGHEDTSRQQEAELAEPVEQHEARVQYRAAVHHLVPPSPRAASRVSRYHKFADVGNEDRAAASTAGAEDTPPAAAEGGRAEAPGGLNRVLRKKLRRLQAAEAKRKAADQSTKPDTTS